MDRSIRIGTVCLVVAACTCLGGCVERRFVITTDPPGAIVFDEKNQPISMSPADRQFTYYGKYRFTLIHDGYETMVVEEPVRAPWYEIIGLDFISETIPWPIRDVRRFHYVLQPKQMVPAEAVLNQALQMRIRGQAIGAPQNVPPEPVPVEGPPPRTVPAPDAGQPPAAVPGPDAGQAPAAIPGDAPIPGNPLLNGP